MMPHRCLKRPNPLREGGSEREEEEGEEAGEEGPKRPKLLQEAGGGGGFCQVYTMSASSGGDSWLTNAALS